MARNLIEVKESGTTELHCKKCGEAITHENYVDWAGDGIYCLFCGANKAFFLGKKTKKLELYKYLEEEFQAMKDLMSYEYIEQKSAMREVKGITYSSGKP